MTTAAQPVADPGYQPLRPDQAQREIEALLGREAAPPVTDTPAKAPAPVTPSTDIPAADAAVTEEESHPEALDGDAQAAEPETSDVAEDAAPDAGQETPTDVPTFAVKVAGETVEVTLDELLKGYSREADYTRKTQAVAAQRAEQEAQRVAFDAEATAVRQERERYASLLGKLEAEMAAELPTNVDWDRLRADDPDAFARQWADFQYKQVQQQRVRAELETTQQRIEADALRTHQQYVATEAAHLLAAIPELKDESKRDGVRRDIAEYAVASGFKPEDLESVADHRVLVLLDKARRYDAWQRSQQNAKAMIAAKVAKATTTVVPGTPGVGTSRVVTDLTRQKQRLAKTGRREDAARAIELALEAADQART